MDSHLRARRQRRGLRRRTQTDLRRRCGLRRTDSERERRRGRRAPRVRALAASRSSEGERTAAARRALDAARTARDSLEKIAPTPRLETSRREELVYLNHLVPGFEAYLSRTIPETESLERLRSILRRGRTHRERGRAAMPAP